MNDLNNILSFSNIYNYIETNQLNIGIIIPHESSGLNNLRQLIFNRNDKTILKKSFTIVELQNHLFHSKNEIDKNFLITLNPTFFSPFCTPLSVCFD